VHRIAAHREYDDMQTFADVSERAYPVLSVVPPDILFRECGFPHQIRDAFERDLPLLDVSGILRRIERYLHSPN
jgi:hypothetical protein